jgi:hypothetical protein
MKFKLVLSFLFFLSTLVFSDAIFQDGGTHIVDYRIINGSIIIDQGIPEAHTHVILNPGGWVDRDVYCLSSSKFTLNGGYVDGYLNFWGNSTGEIQNGRVDRRLYAGDQSSVVINNVYVGDLVLAWNDSHVVVKSGTFGFRTTFGFHRGILATENALVTINGGLISGLLVGSRDNGAYDMSTIMVSGSNFKLNGSELNYGQYYAADFVRDSVGKIGLLTGTLANGDLLNANVYINDGACLYLVPEPTTISLLALGAVLAGRKRRK